MRHQLEPNKGPVSSAERYTSVADYIGTPRRYNYYSFLHFCQELGAFREGLTPAEATEREFEKALQNTRQKMHDNGETRHMCRSY